MVEPPEPSPRALAAGLVVFAALVGGLLLAAVFAGDGSGSGGVLPVGGAAVVLLAASLVVIALGRVPAPRLGRSGVVLVSVMLALVAWTGATVAWSIVPDLSWNAFNKTVALAAFLGLGAVLGGVADAMAVRIGATLLAAVISVTLLWALLGKAVPALDPEGTRVARLNEPIDYWNALALLADVGVVLGLWIGVGNGRRLAARVAGGLLVYVGALSLALTLSRVGVIAGIVVVALWLWLSHKRVEGGLLLVGGALPAAFVASWAYTRPALVEAGATESDRVADGAIFGTLVLGGALLVVALVVVGERRGLDGRSRTRTRRALLVVGAAVAVASAVLLGVGLGNAVSGGRSCSEVVNDPGRLGSLDPNARWCWWNEAVDVFVEHSPQGAGAGTFEIARKRHRVDARSVSQPHSVPLRHLADGGIVALGLVVALVAAAAAACVCALHRLREPERAAGAALVAAPAAYLVHALVDYDWDFLATSAPALMVVGLLAASGRAPGATRTRPVPAAGAVLMALAVLLSFAAPRIAERGVRESTRALIDGQLEVARDRADRARTWNPLAVDPLFALARVEEREDRFDEAEDLYVKAVELQPDNPETWYTLGLFEFQVRRNLCAAYKFLNEAYTLDPAGNQWTPGGELDRARDAVNAGACEPGERDGLSRRG